MSWAVYIYVTSKRVHSKTVCNNHFCDRPLFARSRLSGPGHFTPIPYENRSKDRSTPPPPPRKESRGALWSVLSTRASLERIISRTRPTPRSYDSCKNYSRDSQSSASHILHKVRKVGEIPQGPRLVRRVSNVEGLAAQAIPRLVRQRKEAKEFVSELTHAVAVAALRMDRAHGRDAFGEGPPSVRSVRVYPGVSLGDSGHLAGPFGMVSLLHMRSIRKLQVQEERPPPPISPDPHSE